MLRVSLKNLLSVTRHVTLCALVACSTSIANANPVLDSVASGSVTVQQSPGVTQVNQTSQTAIINWNSFNIGANEATHFQQPTNGVALNRINPQQGASQIFGTLTATGQVILVNQAGIYFGSGAQVNVGGLIASTSDITDKNFLAGNYIFDQASSYANASVVNAGSIIAAQHGLVALLGSNVRNDGYVQAELGSIVLASGSQFTVNFGGDGLVNFSVDAPVAHPAVSNTGMLIADGGKILMSAHAAQSVLDNVINMQGVAQANSVDEQNGEIILDGGDSGYVNVAGVLQASGLSLGQTGGIVKILGENVTLQAPTVVNVSGDAGGGEILVGGNFHGGGPEQNALTTTVSSGSILLADAITQGNGGQVAVWSNGATQFHGTISAKGGAISGNGGYVETSGEYLNILGGSVNTLAPAGQIGTWLLDPSDVTIESNAGTDSNDALSSGIYAPTSAANTSIIDVGNLETALGSSNVTVTTTNSGTSGTGNGDITVNASINWATANTLTLSAYRNIVINPGMTISNSSGGQLVLHANNGGAYPVYSNLTTLTQSGFGWVNNGGTISVNGGLTVYYTPQSYFSPTTYTNTAGSVSAYMLVSNVYDLQNMNTSLSGDYALSKNIDASVTSTWSSGAGFTPIGNSGTPFTGIFDGQNYSISGLWINSPSSTEVGLFGVASGGAQIQNVTLYNFNIAGANNVGTLAGEIDGAATINNITATGNILAGQDGGGLIGEINVGSSDTVSVSNVTTDVAVNGSANDAGYTSSFLGGAIGLANASGSASITLNNLVSHGPVTSLSTSSSSNAIGGLVGELSGTTTLENSSSTSNVTTGASNSIGGLVGVLNGAIITNSSSTGSVMASGNTGLGVGGLAGALTGGGTVSDSYSTSTVQGFDAVGGLVGFMDQTNSNSVTNSYSEGSVRSIDNEPAGGLVGIINGGTIQNSYSGASVTSSNGGGLIGEVQAIGAVTISTNYSSGSVFSYSGVMGYGFIGNLSGSPTLTNNFWDEDTSGQTTGAPSYTAGQLAPLTTAQALQSANYTGWDFASTWYMIDGYTRPILRSEASTTITNAHQLELINLNLSGNYQLASNVDASGTSNAGDVWATSVGSGTGFDPIARGSDFTGSFNGNGYVISNLYMAPTDATNTSYGLFSAINGGATITNVGIMNGTLTSNVGVAANMGLLVGLIDVGAGDLSNNFSTGTVSYTATSGATNLGGLFGANLSGDFVTQSYSSANVANSSTDANSNTGGFIGLISNGGIPNTTESYTTGSVTAAAGSAGGFAGYNNLGLISDVYSTGAVTTTGSATLGGLLGKETVGGRGAGEILTSFWDTTTSGQATGDASNGANDSILGESTANMMNSSTFTTSPANWDISASSGHTWYILSGQTRPILQMEYSTNINTAHQLQLMNLNLAANYTLTGNIDASNTAATNTTDVWAGNTFSPVGSLSTTFTGNLNGQFYTISNLNITSSASEVGLIGAMSGLGSIENLTVSNGNVINMNTSGNNNYAGIVVGVINTSNAYEVVLDNVSTVGGTVKATNTSTGYDIVGGVVGGLGTENTHGGLAENVSNNATVDLSLVTPSGPVVYAGGVVGGVLGGTLNNFSNSGTVIGNQNSYVGGVVGSLDYSSMLKSSYNIGIVEGVTGDEVGGLVGFAGSTDSSSAFSTIQSSYNAGRVIEKQGEVVNDAGGLVGFGAGGLKIFDSYNIGSVVTNSNSDAGGLIGYVSVEVGTHYTIDRTFNAGYVTTNGHGADAPMIGGVNPSAVITTSNDNYFDSDTTAPLSFGYSFGTGQTTAQLQSVTGAAYTAFNSGAPNTWGIADGETYPYLLATNPGGTPQIISGIMPVGANNAVSVATAGSQLANSSTPYYQSTISTAQTGMNGFFYLQEDPIAVPANQVFIAYLTSTVDPLGSNTPPGTKANIISRAELLSQGFGTDGTTGLTGTANTIYVNSTVSGIANGDLANAIGNLGTTDPADFLYTASAVSFASTANITLGNASSLTANFVTSSGTSYTEIGNILSYAGATTSLTFNGPLALEGSSSALTTSGDQTYNNTVTNYGTVLTFNAGANTITFNDVISGSGGGLTFASNTGATILYNAANTYTGYTTVTSGTLMNGVDNAVPSSSNLTVNDTYDLNGFNESTNIGGSGTITNSAGGAPVTLTDTGSGTVTGTIAGNLNLLVSGSSAFLTLSGASTYTGSTNVTNNAGLTLTNANAIPGAIGVDSTSTLFLQSNTFSNTINLSGTLDLSRLASVSGPIHLGADATINNSGATTISGTIDGAYNLTIQGSGTVTLNGNINGINSLTTSLTLGRRGGTAQIDLGNITLHTLGDVTFNNNVVVNSGSIATINAGGNVVFNNPLDGTLGAGTETLNIGAASTTFAANVGSTKQLQISGNNVNNDFIFGDGVTLAGTLNGGGGGTNTLDFSAYTTPVAFTLSTAEAGTAVNNSSANIVIFSNFNSLIGNGAGGTPYTSTLNLPTSDTPNTVTLSLGAANQGVQGSFSDPVSFNFINQINGQSSGIDQISFSGFSATSGSTVNGVQLFFTNLIQQTAANTASTTTTTIPSANIISAVYPVSTTTMSNSSSSSSSSSNNLSAVTYTASGATYYSDPVSVNLENLTTQQTQQDTASQPTSFGVCPAVN